MPSRRNSYQGGRGTSIYVDLKDHIPDFYQQYPEVSVTALKATAEAAKDAVEPTVPMKTGAMRENTRVVGYKRGNLGGTVYVQWNARNPKNGYPYPRLQEQGGTREWIYVDYTTPGTSEGFMKRTWDLIVEKAPSDLAQATRNLAQEISV